MATWTVLVPAFSDLTVIVVFPFFRPVKTAFPSLKDIDRYSESYSQSRDDALAFSGSMVISNTVSYPVYRNNVSGTVKDVTGTGFTETVTVVSAFPHLAVMVALPGA